MTHQWVPKEPTEAMVDRACAERINLYPAFKGEKPEPTGGEVAICIYKAMLAAAPAAPAPAAADIEETAQALEEQIAWAQARMESVSAIIATALRAERERGEAQLRQNTDDGDEAINAFKFGMSQQSDRAEAAEAQVKTLTEALTELAAEDFVGSKGISILTAASNELLRRTKIARAALATKEPTWRSVIGATASSRSANEQG